MEDVNNYWDNSKYQYCAYAERLLNELILLNKKVKQPIDMYEVKKGIYYAKKYHGSQMRQSGEPYYSHPIEVAYMLAQYTALEIPKYFRTDMIVTALLHDTIEDTKLTEKMIAYIFGSQVASQVEDLTRVKPSGKISSAEMVEMLYKEKKHDVLLVKLFDRLHNIQTVSAKSPEKAKKIIEETLRYFVVLAEYLGLPSVSKLIHTYTTINVLTDIDLNATNFSYQNNYQPLSLIYQNALHQNYNL
ncbi:MULTISPECIES: HD domain-containing protein [unclassified Candidatus Tisiphia]|uniref:HD domain-containing protein n=1 Tax=unclassified Candidatus Tisiphia TaxID=2996318 RepID=UPI001E719E3D|nr:MAG: HD domain-containing protein [Rickettsia endosymbiont of Cimex lectularius]